MAPLPTPKERAEARARAAELAKRSTLSPEERAQCEEVAKKLGQEMCENIRSHKSTSVSVKSKIDLAIEFAAIAHAGQKRKGTNVDYIVHPVAVGQLLTKAGCEDDVIIAGYLHDVPEDTKYTLQDIASRFGYRVAGIVEGCIEPNKNLPWDDRKQHTLSQLRKAPREVEFVVLADKLHNVESMLKDYASFGEELWSRFREGRDKQEWYYRGLVSVFNASTLRYHDLVEQFSNTVNSLFRTRDEATSMLEDMSDEEWLYSDLCREEWEENSHK